MSEELKPQENKPKVEGGLKVEQLLEKLKTTYDELSPEKQVVFGVFASYVYLVMLISPELLPERVQPIMELLDKFPMSNISVWIATMTAVVGSIDGVRRIITERLPFYKAYVQVFLLHNFEDSEKNDFEYM